MTSAAREKTDNARACVCAPKLLAVIGEQLDVGDEICGVGVSMRYNEDILSVWTRTASDNEAKKFILLALQRAVRRRARATF